MLQQTQDTQPSESSTNRDVTTDEDRRKEAVKFIERGRSAARNQKYKDAIENLAHATHLHETNAEAFYYLGLAHSKLKEYNAASQALMKAINCSKPETPTIYYYKYAFACQNDNQTQTAISYYTEYLNRTDEKDSYSARLNRGICYDTLGKYELALEDFANAIQLASETDLPYCLTCQARTKAKNNDGKGALNDYDEAVCLTGAYISMTNQSKKLKKQGERILFLLTYDPESPLGILESVRIKTEKNQYENLMDDLNTLFFEKLESFTEQINDLEIQSKEAIEEEDQKSVRRVIISLENARETVSRHQQAFEKFKKGTSLSIFYRVVFYRLEELFIAAKSIASGRIAPQGGKAEKPLFFLSIAGKVISLLPIGCELIGNAVDLVHTIATEIDSKQQTKLFKMIADVGPLQQLWNLSQMVAQRLTEIYQPLLEELKVSNDEGNDNSDRLEPSKSKKFGCFSFGKKTVTQNKELMRSTVAAVAEYGVGMILEFLLTSGKIDKAMQDTDMESLAHHLIGAVTIPWDENGRINRILKNLFRDDIIITEETKKKWTYEGFYRSPGIQTVDKKIYRNPRIRSNLYPDRNGTEEEAVELKYQRVK